MKKQRKPRDPAGKKMYIEIEEMMFNDFRVQVWDKNLDSLLDREYFCRGYASALTTAFELRYMGATFAGLEIWHRRFSQLERVLG